MTRREESGAGGRNTELEGRSVAGGRNQELEGRSVAEGRNQELEGRSVAGGRNQELEGEIRSWKEESGAGKEDNGAEEKQKEQKTTFVTSPLPLQPITSEKTGLTSTLFCSSSSSLLLWSCHSSSSSSMQLSLTMHDHA